MPVNPSNKAAKERLQTEKKIASEQSKQKKFAEGFRDINNEIKNSIHDMTLSQQSFFRTTVQTKSITKQINDNLLIAQQTIGAESDARKRIADWMKQGVVLCSQSLTDSTKHADIQSLIEKV